MSSPNQPANTPAPAANFIRNIVEADLAAGKHAQRRWAGQPRRRRPPRRRRRSTRRRSAPASRPSPTATCTSATPNRICLNFGLARDYGGVCHLRFDDTNPEKEEQEYVDAIIDAVQWLGFRLGTGRRDHLYHASNYFDLMYRAAPST